jgi:hypothetical protein
MIYRPHILDLAKIVNRHKGVFSTIRWIRLPRQVFLGYLKRPSLKKIGYELSDPTVVPILADKELKPGFHWKELIH